MEEIQLTIDDLKATGLTCESKWCISIRSKPNGYVTIKWVSQRQPQKHRTEVVKSTASPEWKETVKLFYQSMDSTISFEMFDKGHVHRHSYGIVQKTVRELLATPKLDIPFPPHDAVLSITVKREDIESAASHNLRTAQEATQKLAQVPYHPEISVSPYAPLGEVVASLAKFMDIADTLAEIHPYAKVAWSTVSAVYKVVKDQLERDDAIRELLEAMAMLYGQSGPLKDHKKELSPDIVKTIRRILEQTIECSLFIQEYSGKGFAGRSINYSLSTTADTKIADFKQAFIELRKCLDTGLSVDIALVSIRIAHGVDELAIAIDELARKVDMPALKSKLEPAAVEWTGRPICHPHTRTDIQDYIMKWILDPNGSNVLWLIGRVGAGKSTLATTVADTYARSTRRLGAFVFFNRDVEKQNNPDNFVRTLAYELSKYDHRICKKILAAVERDSRIAQGSLDGQFKDLIQGPLAENAAEGKPLASEGPIVIVIDALDECGNQSTRKQLLKVLATRTKNLPQVVRIIITSRPEPDIHAQFDNQKHIKPLEVLPNDTDVRVYMKSQLKEIAEENKLGDGWPDDVKLARLVYLAGGLFIWAFTACKYISLYQPKAALDNLLQEGVHKGKELDDLYSRALEHACDWTNDSLRKDFRDIIGTISVAKNPMTTKTIDKFLRLDSSKELLSRVSSVIHLTDNEPVRIFHKSFSDFITDPERCTNSTWLINLSHHEHRAALNCIAQMKEAFKTPHHFALVITPEVDYDEAVKYSCSYWIHHVIAVEEDPDRAETAKAVYDFMEEHTMHWLEAMSVLKLSHITPGSLDKLYKWATGEGTEDLKALAYDAYRFTTFFTATIAWHPAMITQVALPFAPLESKLYQLFHNHCELPTVIGGYQQKWSPFLRTFPQTGGVSSASFSRDMTKVVYTASNTHFSRQFWVACREAATGTETFPSLEFKRTSAAQFSLDGTQIWVATRLGSVYVLDVDTGNLVSELPWNTWRKKHPPQVSRLASPSSRHRSSSDARSFLGSAPGNRTPSRPPSSMHHSVSPDSVVPESHGLGDSEAEVSTLHDAEKGGNDSTQIFDRAVLFPVDPTAPGDLASGLEEEGDFTRAAFSGDGKWVIFGNNSSKLYVIDCEARKPAYGVLDDCSRLQLDEDDVGRCASIVFSPDSEVFAAGSGDGRIYVWQTKTGRRLRMLEGHAAEVQHLAFSSGGDKLYSISSDGNVRIWAHTTGVCVSSVTIDRNIRRIFTPMAFSHDGRLASASDHTIHIWDASTGEEVGPILQVDAILVSTVAFSQDGSMLVSGTSGNIRTWDVSGSGKGELTEHSRHNGFPHAVAFSPSGLIVRSARTTWPDSSTKFWSAVTGRELKMVLYDESADFITQFRFRRDSDDEEIKRKIQVNKEKFNDAPDTLMTSSGDIITLVDSLPNAELSELERKWEDAIKKSNPGVSTWRYSRSRIVYHHPTSNTDDDSDGQEIWRLPFELRSNDLSTARDIRPNFITFGLDNGRVFIIHIPEKLVVRNTTKAA